MSAPADFTRLDDVAVYYNPTTGVVVITGSPHEDGPEEGAGAHDCDAMGCRAEHVLAMALVYQEHRAILDTEAALRGSASEPVNRGWPEALGPIPAARGAVVDGVAVVSLDRLVEAGLANIPASEAGEFNLGEWSRKLQGIDR